MGSVVSIGYDHLHFDIVFSTLFVELYISRLQISQLVMRRKGSLRPHYGESG